jgi:hypothetical protein
MLQTIQLTLIVVLFVRMLVVPEDPPDVADCVPVIEKQTAPGSATSSLHIQNDERFLL